MTTILARIEADAVVVWDYTKAFLEKTVEEEITALAPIVETAVSAVVADAGALLTPGGWAAAITNAISAIAPQLESTGLKVAGASLLSAVGSALANVQATAAGAPSVPISAPPPATPPAFSAPAS
jgi:hypothetical protein